MLMTDHEQIAELSFIYGSQKAAFRYLQVIHWVEDQRSFESVIAA